MANSSASWTKRSLLSCNQSSRSRTQSSEPHPDCASSPCNQLPQIQGPDLWTNLPLSGTEEHLGHSVHPPWISRRPQSPSQLNSNNVCWVTDALHLSRLFSCAAKFPPSCYLLTVYRLLWASVQATGVSVLHYNSARKAAIYITQGEKISVTTVATISTALDKRGCVCNSLARTPASVSVTITTNKCGHICGII